MNTANFTILYELAILYKWYFTIPDNFLSPFGPIPLLILCTGHYLQSKLCFWLRWLMLPDTSINESPGAEIFNMQHLCLLAKVGQIQCGSLNFEQAKHVIPLVISAFSIPIPLQKRQGEIFW